MDIKITNLQPHAINFQSQAASKSKATNYGTLRYNECPRNLYARNSISSSSISLRILSEEVNYSPSQPNSPIAFLLKSVEALLDNNLNEIEIIGTSVLRSLSQIGSACVNHKNGIFMLNSPWSKEIIKLEATFEDWSKTKFLIHDSNPSEQKIFELTDLAILNLEPNDNSIQMHLSPGQCLLLDSKNNFIKRISFCSDFLCKYSSNLESNNISLFASSGSSFDSSNFFLNSRNLAATRCYQYFNELLGNLITIEDQLCKLFSNHTVSQLFERLTFPHAYKIRNHSKMIFDNIDLPMLNMCISASTACDANLSTLVNCNAFASDIFYRKFLSNWIIHWSPYI